MAEAKPEAAKLPPPKGLAAGGLELWAELGVESLTVSHRALLIEACRVRDRLDVLHLVLSGDRSTWLELKANRSGVIHVNVDGVLAKANQMATLLATLLEKVPARPTPKAAGTSAGGRKTGLEQLRERRTPGPRAATGKSTRSRAAERRRPRK